MRIIADGHAEHPVPGSDESNRRLAATIRGSRNRARTSSPCATCRSRTPDDDSAPTASPATGASAPRTTGTLGGIAQRDLAPVEDSRLSPSGQRRDATQDVQSSRAADRVGHLNGRTTARDVRRATRRERRPHAHARRAAAHHRREASDLVRDAFARAAWASPTALAAGGEEASRSAQLPHRPCVRRVVARPLEPSAGSLLSHDRGVRTSQWARGA